MGKFQGEVDAAEEGEGDAGDADAAAAAAEGGDPTPRNDIDAGEA